MAEWSTSTTRITIDGKTYSSVDEMPPEAREKYEKMMSMLADRDGNGVPDILEGKGDPHGVAISKVFTTTRTLGLHSGKQPNLGGGDPSASIVARPADQQDGAANPGGVTIRLSWTTILVFAAVIAVIAMFVASAFRR